ncbi:hypothetical protein TTHERM_00420250 (macronuclear) [Tetrahymena thermophila SB210]|uniref:Transmembrane protein n=1 Tax=Tetrahymena thermophila (strain SB210) TaxID=312017 RepID=I7MGZ4_TETTS|nr:hypothetical protein TTHERM_00420250 [Tetrahymena thermophila SB210]EAR85617.2 hypothetical protein TTHERM_00420250 [Tetrahymena thermophila SB210]|eukprot:XP_001033280.2 hypothetical protein TTHERM_00420250 [Tetrahymena thermophila SB210]
MKILLFFQLFLIIKLAYSIDLERLKMYKQKDQEYIQKQTTHRNNEKQELQDIYRIKDTLQNAEENYKNYMSQMNFPQVNYTYKDIPSVFNDKLLQFTDTQKFFDAFNSMVQKEIQFEMDIQKMKKRQYQLREVSQQIMEHNILILKNQSNKLEQIVNNFKNRLDSHKKSAKMETQNLQTNNKYKLINLEDFMASIFKVYKHISHQQEKYLHKKKDLKQQQIDFSNMSKMLVDSSQKNCIKLTQQKFIETKKIIQQKIDSGLS